MQLFDLANHFALSPFSLIVGLPSALCMEWIWNWIGLVVGWLSLSISVWSVKTSDARGGVLLMMITRGWLGWTWCPPSWESRPARPLVLTGGATLSLTHTWIAHECLIKPIRRLEPTTALRWGRRRRPPCISIWQRPGK